MRIDTTALKQMVQALLDNPSVLGPSIYTDIIKNNENIWYVNDEETEKHFVCSMDWLHRYTTEQRWDVVGRAMEVLAANILNKVKEKEVRGLGQIIVSRIKTPERDGIKVQVNYV